MNFEIAFTPVYRPGTSLSVSVAGAVLSLNGDAVDLSALEDGDILPGEVADGLHPMLAYVPIKRVGNTIHLTLTQPYGYTPAYEGPPINRHSGNVNLPFPAEGEPISGGATIVVDGDAIIRGTDLAQAAALAARKAAFPDLEPDRFWFMVRISGYEQNIKDWVAGMADTGSEAEPNPAYDPVGAALISAKLEFAKYFERDHPFIAEAIDALGIAEAEIDALWQFAAFG